MNLSLFIPKTPQEGNKLISLQSLPIISWFKPLHSSPQLLPEQDSNYSLCTLVPASSLISWPLFHTPPLIQVTKAASPHTYDAGFSLCLVPCGCLPGTPLALSDSRSLPLLLRTLARVHSSQEPTWTSTAWTAILPWGCLSYPGISESDPKWLSWHITS